MQPIAGRDTPLGDVFAAQDLLTDQCHHYGMIHVVVRSITVGDVFHCQPCDEPDNAGIIRLERPVGLVISPAELNASMTTCIGLNIAVSWENYVMCRSRAAR